MVEDNGIEPLTPCLQSRCSPSWANPPFVLVMIVCAIRRYSNPRVNCYTSGFRALSCLTLKPNTFWLLDKQIFKNQVVQGRGLRRIHWVCKHSDNAEIRRLLTIWWVWMDSNHRPPPYQDGALTSWATDPVKVTITLRLWLCWSIIAYCDCVRTTDKCECLQSRFVL